MAIPTTVSNSLLGTNESSAGAMRFGITGTPLQFSQPVQIVINVGSYNQSTIGVRVQHGGTGSFVTTGLTNDANAVCTNGVPSTASNIATVLAGYATIYTCSASTFVAYTVSTPVISSPVTVTSGGGGGSSYSTPSTSSVSTPVGASLMTLGLPTLSRMLGNTENTVTSVSGESITLPRDITKNKNKESIVTLMKKGYVNSSLLFVPNRMMTRAEFIKIIVLANGYTPEEENPAQQIYADVAKDSEFVTYIEFAAKNKWISTSSLLFRPNDKITLWEATKILSTITGKEVDNSIHKTKKLTRGNAASLILQTLNLK